MEIKSTLINDEEFKWVKNSILNADNIDGEGSFRVKLIEYINDTADNDDDKYFFDMLPFVRFLEPGSDHIAYTDEAKRIFLNAPCQHIGKNFKQWDFTFDHECLHQLWDTFGVRDKLIADGYEYNHYVLNIASDCVINDYLSYYRKKEQAPNTITPQYLKEKFGVEYDRKVDTQYTLYLKLIEEKDKIEKDPLCQEISGKIKPKEVRKQNGPTPPPPPPQGKHSKDFIKGWTDAIKDVVDKKVDPTDTNLKPKKTGNNEYDAGYNSAIDNMKEGLENGIDISSNGGGNNGGGSDLPQIPWDTDNDSDGGSGDDESDKDDSSDGGGSSDKSDAESANDSASNAQNAADAAKEAADAAQKAADAAAEAGDENADDMQDAADKAAKEAKKAQRAANKAKKAAEEAAEAEADGDKEGASEAAKEAKDAAKKASDAAKEAANATKKTGDLGEESDDGDTQDAGKKANEAADKANKAADNAEGKEAENSSNSSDNSNNKSQKAGKGHVAPVETAEDLEKLKRDAEDVINEYKNKLAGDLGEFLAKCKSSVKLEKDGLAAQVTKGVKGWNVELDQRINKFVKQKVFQKKRQWQSTYSRVKRGTGYVKMGEPLQPGRRVKDDTMVINVAFYIDRSVSMGSALDTVFDACYVICEALKKRYRKEKVVEDIMFKVLAFDDNITEVKFGKKTSLGGGTMSMSELLKSIQHYSNNYLINVVITDGYFDINDSEVKKFIEDVNGIVVYIVNRDFPEMEKLANQLKTKLFFIRADGNFKIK